VLAAIALATLVAVHRAVRGRSGLRRLALVLVLGIPAQALIGGVTVLTELNPWVVMLHFMLSAVLIAVAAVLVRRVERVVSGEPAPPRPQGRQRWVAGLGLLTWVVGYATIYVGTVVTGSGPHAGDPDARRTGLDLESVTQLHADLVFLLVGLTVGLLVAARAAGAPQRTVRAATVLLGVELAQGLVGAAQVATDLPVVLVALHLLGAALLAAAVTDAALAARLPLLDGPEAATPGADGAPGAQSVRMPSPASLAT
jgi:cytochrome c oxidase assembly protein subunit 15